LFASKAPIVARGAALVRVFLLTWRRNPIRTARTGAKRRTSVEAFAAGFEPAVGTPSMFPFGADAQPIPDCVLGANPMA
jgi:hypothetical protein